MVESLVWQEIRIQCGAQEAPLIDEQLTELGADAVSFEDAADNPIYEPSSDNLQLWDQTIVVGLFRDDIDLETIQTQFSKTHPVQLKKIQDQDWVRLTLNSFQPMTFGKLTVYPSWFTIPEKSSPHMLLNPGLAFGTGTHATTRLCLNWLSDTIKGNELVIDYGCGSGILGIAALKLGAKHVIAIDNDPQAIEASLQNAALNDLVEHQFVAGLPNQNISQADILIANILANPLKSLAEVFSQTIKSGGKIAVSGILHEQIEEIEKNFSTWFDLNCVKYQDDWCLLAGVRK